MIPVEEFKNYIDPKKSLLKFDMMKRNKGNMHKIILDLDEGDLQWLFSPVHIREVFKIYTMKHKEGADESDVTPVGS